MLYPLSYEGGASDTTNCGVLSPECPAVSGGVWRSSAFRDDE